YPPTAVIYDTNTLYTLPTHEIRSGYAELVKEAFISNQDDVNRLLKISLTHITLEQMKEHLYKGMAIKSKVVEKDEQDHGQRNFLNFGHTFGHAVETILGHGKITHGEAIAIGMLFALYVSEETFNITLPYNDLKKWMEYNDYPFTVGVLHCDELYRQMTYDKKTIRSQIKMVLLKNIGEPALHPIDEQTLKTHIKTFINHI